MKGTAHVFDLAGLAVQFGVIGAIIVVVVLFVWLLSRMFGTITASNAKALDTVTKALLTAINNRIGSIETRLEEQSERIELLEGKAA